MIRLAVSINTWPWAVVMSIARFGLFVEDAAVRMSVCSCPGICANSVTAMPAMIAASPRAKGKAVRAGHTEQGIDTALAEAHRMLAEVYNWFTEGFDTKDLQEAKALLGDLGEKAKWGNGKKEKG
jgi:hypothetical protein